MTYRRFSGSRPKGTRETHARIDKKRIIRVLKRARGALPKIKGATMSSL